MNSSCIRLSLIAATAAAAIAGGIGIGATSTVASGHDDSGNGEPWTSTHHAGAIGTVTVTDMGPLSGQSVAAETVKKGARITGADRAKLAGELTK